MEQSRIHTGEQDTRDFKVGDLVQSTVRGVQDFEFNSFGRIGVLVEVINARDAAKVWWFGEERAKTVLFRTFTLLSRTKGR